MATAPMSSDTARLSFAKVAASAGKDNIGLGTYTKTATPASIRISNKENISMQEKASVDSHTLHTPLSDTTNSTAGDVSTLAEAPSTTDTSPPDIETANLIDAVKSLSVDSPMPSLVVNGSGSANIKKLDVIEGFSEDPFQRTDSGSELGTKPPSLDGKSITSGTTFALDEKESLRPDDSASVKAADDDDTFSGRGSIVAGSRIGSEAAARAYRAEFHETSIRRNMQPMPERQSQGMTTPQSGSSEQQTTDDGKPNKQVMDPSGGPDAFNLFYRQTPDDKLLEALESPKDRIFLLRLEKDVIEFVKDSTDPFIDLPPCNSFCRMLTHKLADYYHLTHQVDPVQGAVRIFRTPFCRLPPSLTSISNPPTSGNTPPPAMPAMKIMRRGGDGDTGPSPSKATSEAGSEGNQRTLSAKEKLSREEREAAYNRARERIFGKDEKTGDATPDTEDGVEMSRSSSVSTKDRSQSKKPKKQRRDDSESFDVRSQYTPFFPQPQLPTWAPTPQYSPAGPQPFNGNVPNSFQHSMPSQYGPPAQQYNHVQMNSGTMPVYSTTPQQYPQINQPRFQPHSAPITAYGSPAQPQHVIPHQQWQQQQQPMYQAPYQPRGPMGSGSQNSIPYAFGQLPNNGNPADPKNQHPIPGSFNRHAFNPKTQSFVPGNGGLPLPQPMSHHGSPHHGSPHHGSPHLTYNAYTPPQPQYGNGMGYNMARQGSNNSLPSYHASPHMTQRPMMHQGMQQGMSSNVPQGIPIGMVQGMPHGISHGTHQSVPQHSMPQQSVPQGMPQVLPQGQHQGLHIGQSGQVGNLPHYGNPATLPPKPPTGV